MENQFRVNS